MAKGVRIGRVSDDQVLYFIPPHFIWDVFHFPSWITVHSEGAAGDGVTVDAEGNVYAGEVGTRNLIQLEWCDEAPEGERE